MPLIKKVHQLADRIFGLAKWIFPLAARFTIGVVFIESGWAKLHNIPQVVEFFASLKIPAPEIQARFVATVEFVCGLGIALGLLTRAMAVPLIGTMFVAIITAKLDDIEGWTDILALSEFLYIVVLTGLIAYGPGVLSLDWLLRRRLGLESSTRG